MIATYIVLLILVLIGCRFNKNGFNEDFSGKEQANVIKGIFIWMVFISHISQYIVGYMPELKETLFYSVRSFIGQMIVVPFLFYSGYGVLTSVKNRGGYYINSMPKKRILSTLANFDVAVLAFMLLNLALSVTMDLKQILLSFVCWDSVGNSNWYIFSIIMCYLITYLCARKFGYTKKGVIAICGVVFLYSVVMGFLKESWWYDTVFAYAAGAVYAFYKEQIDEKLKSRYAILLLASIVCFVACSYLPNVRGIATNIRSLFFMLSILLITMKVEIRNVFLSWSGKNLFPLYIYQRLPMIALASFGGSLVLNQTYLYILLSLGVTLLIARFYHLINITIK